MLAFKMKIADALRGMTVQVYLVVEFTNIYLSEKDANVLVVQRSKVEEPPDRQYNINDIRRLSGIDDIYCIYDTKNWDTYYGLISQHKNELLATDKMLKDDPVIQKDIAEHRKDMKEYAIWKAAQQWKEK